MPKLTAENLQAIVVRILLAAGAPRHIATVVARYIVDADLCGYPSHGVNTIPSYIDDVAAGRIDPKAEPEVSQSGADFIQVEGHKSFGHYAIDWVIPKLLAQLNTQAVCLATVRNIGHVGRLGGYVETLSHLGCVALMTAGVALDPHESAVAPTGSAVRRLGTNPIAIAVPTTRESFVYDTSTAAATVFGILKAARGQSTMPAGALIDAQGNATTNPEDFFAGGSVLPFGGHKGFGLSLGTCLLGALSGDCAPQAGRFGGVALLTIRIDAFMPRDAYCGGVNDFLSIIRSTPSLHDSPVRVPGDRARAEREKHRSEGVNISQETWNLLMRCQNEIGVLDETSKREEDVI